MERCINVVFMNLFGNINKQYQNNCLSIIHFKSFTDGSFKFSLQQGTIGMFLSNFNLFKIRYLFLELQVEKSILFGRIILNQKYVQRKSPCSKPGVNTMYLNIQVRVASRYFFLESILMKALTCTDTAKVPLNTPKCTEKPQEMYMNVKIC